MLQIFTPNETRFYYLKEFEIYGYFWIGVLYWQFDETLILSNKVPTYMTFVKRNSALA